MENKTEKFEDLKTRTPGKPGMRISTLPRYVRWTNSATCHFANPYSNSKFYHSEKIHNFIKFSNSIIPGIVSISQHCHLLRIHFLSPFPLDSKSVYMYTYKTQFDEKQNQTETESFAIAKSSSKFNLIRNS
jgi:hypothetical protein